MATKIQTGRKPSNTPIGANCANYKRTIPPAPLKPAHPKSIEEIAACSYWTKSARGVVKLPAMDARVETVIKAMSREPRDRLSIGTLSRIVNLSPGRVYQLFKKETGRSPMQYFR